MGAFKTEKEMRLISLQNYLFGIDSNSLIKSEKQIDRAANSFIMSYRKKITVTVDKIKTSENFSSVFRNVEKIKFYVYEIKKMCDQCEGVIEGFNRVAANIEFEIDSLIPDAIDIMIDKCWSDTLFEAVKYDSKKSRLKILRRFLKSADNYSNKLFPQNLEHMKELCLQYDSIQ